ncbi:MAG: TonB-dependent receptor, partial [Flavihumibacter sp.]
VSVKHPSGVSGSIRTRWMGDRAANEDNSIVAKGYCVTDMNASYSWKQVAIGLVAENIFNTAWKETQFATTSRLKNEPAPVTEIHFTPGTPFNIRGQLRYRF